MRVAEDGARWRAIGVAYVQQWTVVRVAEDRARWPAIGEAYVQQWTVVG
jgi:hypothetical protein